MTSSPKTIAQIPTISELRHELDFAEGDRPHYDCHDFIDDLRSFRRVFRTAAGTDGRDLHQWKSRDHHLGLREMVDAYLDRDGKGVEFWPDDPSKRYFSSSLQYTKDKSLIQQNLKLLLFRLNLQQHRNAKYKHTKQPKSGAHATRLGEPSNIDEAIRISAIWPAEEDVKPTNLASQPYTIIKFSASGAAADTLPTDPFAVPSSPESSQPLAQRGFRVVGGEKSQTSSKTTPDAHRAKRTKTQHDGPDGLTRSAPIVIPEDSQEDPEEDETPAAETRRTPRRNARQKRRDPIYASPEDYDAATRAPDRTPAATSEAMERTRKKAAAKAARPDSASKPSQVVKLKLPQASSAQLSAGQHRQLSAQPSTSQTIPRASDQPPTSNAPAYVAPVAHMTEVSTEQTPDMPSAGLRPSEQTDQPSGPEPPPGTSTKSVPAPSTSEKATETSVPVNQPMEDTTTPSTATAKEAPAVHFTYRLVISREHPEKNKEWTPQGGFRDMTLVRLMREMPLDFDTDFSGFQFTLWGPAVRVSHRVLNGQNDEFDAMKQKFEASIVSCMMEAQSGKTIDFELEVQPITPEVQAAPAPAVHGLAAPQW